MLSRIPSLVMSSPTLPVSCFGADQSKDALEVLTLLRCAASTFVCSSNGETILVIC